MIPHGAELCITYATPPTWPISFPKTGTNTIQLPFYTIWENDKPYPWGGPIYNAVVTCASITTASVQPGSTYTNAVAPLATTTTTTSVLTTQPTPTPFQHTALVANQEPFSSTQSPEQHYMTPLTIPTSSSGTPTSHYLTSTGLAPTVTSCSTLSTSSCTVAELANALGAMQLQMNTLMDKLLTHTAQDLETVPQEQLACNCQGACSCPALQHSEQDCEDSDSTAAADTDWDTDTDNTLTAEQRVSWFSQQNELLTSIQSRQAQIAADHSVALALQTYTPGVPTAPPPVAPHGRPNWASLLETLRGRKA